MARRVSLCVLAVLCLCFLLQTNVALGQAVFGSVIGTVTDAQGAGSGAKVTVTSTSKNTVRNGHERQWQLFGHALNSR